MFTGVIVRVQVTSYTSRFSSGDSAPLDTIVMHSAVGTRLQDPSTLSHRHISLDAKSLQTAQLSDIAVGKRFDIEIILRTAIPELPILVLIIRAVSAEAEILYGPPSRPFLLQDRDLVVCTTDIDVDRVVVPLQLVQVDHGRAGRQGCGISYD